MSAQEQQENLFGTIEIGVGMPQDTSANRSIPSDDASVLLKELVGLFREQLKISNELVELAKRQEERFLRQQQMQREEFQRWLNDHSSLRGNCKPAEETLRKLVGQTIESLVDYVNIHDENLLESDFSRTDLVDRYGSLMNHLSGMYTMLKRLSTIETQINEQAKTE